MTIAVGISEVTSVLAALFVGVRNRNANHITLGIGEHHRVLRRVIWTDPNRIAAMTKLPGKILVMLPPI
jgi:hypothetical protein